MPSKTKRFNYSEAASKVGDLLCAVNVPNVPYGSRGRVVGMIEKSRGFNLIASFSYQRLTFGETDHEHEITRRKYEASRLKGTASR